jgi:hypothetical protein
VNISVLIARYLIATILILLSACGEGSTGDAGGSTTPLATSAASDAATGAVIVDLSGAYIEIPDGALTP